MFCTCADLFSAVVSLFMWTQICKTGSQQSCTCKSGQTSVTSSRCRMLIYKLGWIWFVQPSFGGGFDLDNQVQGVRKCRKVDKRGQIMLHHEIALWLEALSEGSIQVQLAVAIRNMVPSRKIAEELRRPRYCDQGEQVLLSPRKVTIHLLVAKYLARAAFHPCLHLFQSQTSAKHKN